MSCHEAPYARASLYLMELAFEMRSVDYRRLAHSSKLDSASMKRFRHRRL